MYESISFTADKSPDYEVFKDFFADNGQLISVKDTTSFTLTPADYEQMMSKQRKSGSIISFTEKELHWKLPMAPKRPEASIVFS